MRLIDTSTGELKYFTNDDEVQYAILSHRWEEGEVSLQDFVSGAGQAKNGFPKIQNASKEALKMNIPYLWVDTCCIDKFSSAELSEAINSMYRWYQQAEVCFAYLSDVDSIDDMAGSMWFTRGWTLQELIAPKKIRFYSKCNKTWRCFGTKAGLQDRLSSITKIPTRVLRGTKPTTCSIAQRMSWAADRVTTRPEDIAYCLMGLFEVNMPLLYGEGKKAFARLQEEIIKISDDETIFAWSNNKPGYKSILAASPMCFRDCGNMISPVLTSAPRQYSMTNVGLSITLPLIPWSMDTHLALLECTDASDLKDLMPQYRPDISNTRTGIFLRNTGREQQFVRVSVEAKDVHHVNVPQLSTSPIAVSIFIIQRVEERDESHSLYGFILRDITGDLFPHSDYTVISRRNPTETHWSSGFHYRHYAREDDEGELRLRGRFGLQTVTAIESPNGEQGIIAHLHSNDDGCTASGDSLQGATCIANVAFGFDFWFHPVCILRSTASLQESECPLHSEMNRGKDFFNRYLIDSSAVERLVEQTSPNIPFGDRPRTFEDEWDQRGFVAVRGKRESGLDLELDFLNLHINISKGLMGRTTKAWIIDINAIQLPYEGLHPPPRKPKARPSVENVSPESLSLVGGQ